MNKKIILVIIILIIIIATGIMLFSKKEVNEDIEKEEIKPEEEISEKQERETMVILYFKNKETNELTKEVRIIDAKELKEDPYKKLIEMMIEGPKNEKLLNTIPEKTKINDIYIKGDIVYIDFSEEFIESHEGGLENESKTIYSIVNTLSELNEVNYVKILINGEEGKEFKDGKMNFKENFEKNN